MENIKKSIQANNPEIKMKKYEFLELDYELLFGDLVPHYITQLRGIRIWKENNLYSIQENTIFKVGLSEEDVIQLITDKYEELKRMAKIEAKTREEKEKQLKILLLKRQKEQIQAKQELPQETVDFLLSILKD